MDTVSFTSELNHHGKNYVVALTSSHITWHQEEHKEQKLMQKKGTCRAFLSLLDLMSSDLRNFCNYINVINYKIAINREKNKFQSSGFFQLSIQQGNCQI